MRNTALKKRPHESQKNLHSRILASSSSLTPLSQQISSKIDIIKQQLEREYHQKFPTQKKRAQSTNKKTHSASKTKMRQSIQGSRPRVTNTTNAIFTKKLNFNTIIDTPCEGNFEERSREYQKDMESYRSKYYELQDKYLVEKEKVLAKFEECSNMRQRMLDFLEEPTHTNMQNLKQYFSSQRGRNCLQKIITLNQDVNFAQNTLNQIMGLLEVEDIEAVLTELSSRYGNQGKSKNLDECTYKILELQAKYNKLQMQKQEILQKKQKQFIENQKQLKQTHREEIEKLQQNLQEKLRQLTQNHKAELVEFICAHGLFDSESHIEGSELVNSSLSKEEIRGECKDHREQLMENSTTELIGIIAGIFINVHSHILAIQKEAQQNMHLFTNSKTDMLRLQHNINKLNQAAIEEREKLIEQFSQEISAKQNIIMELHKIIHHKSEIIQTKQKQVAQVNGRVEKLKGALEQKQKQIQAKDLQILQVGQQLEQKEQQFVGIAKQFQKITLECFDENETNLFSPEFKNGLKLYKQQTLPEYNKIMQDLKQTLSATLEQLAGKVKKSQQVAQWQQRQIQAKQQLLQEFKFNLKKLTVDSQALTESNKKLSFERDQYKFLLTNMREQTIEMKKQQQLKIERAIQQKDQEYLNSNKQILYMNTTLQKEKAALNSELQKLEQEYKDEKASRTFYQKKAEQQENTLSQQRKKILSAENEVSRYKKHLAQIQASFREVQSISEINSMKMIGLEKENQDIIACIHSLKERNVWLQKQMDEVNSRYNKVRYEYEDLFRKLENMRKVKEDIQCQNSELRIRNLDIGEKHARIQSELRQSKVQREYLAKEKKKLQFENNGLTKKVLAKQASVLDSENNMRLKKEIKRKLNYLQAEVSKIKNSVNIALKQQGKVIQETLLTIGEQLLRREHQFAKSHQHQIANQFQQLKLSQYDQNNCIQNCSKHEQKKPHQIYILPTVHVRLRCIKEDLQNNKQYLKLVHQQLILQSMGIQQFFQQLNQRTQIQEEIQLESKATRKKTINHMKASIGQMKQDLLLVKALLIQDKAKIGQFMVEIKTLFTKSIQQITKEKESDVNDDEYMLQEDLAEQNIFATRKKQIMENTNLLSKQTFRKSSQNQKQHNTSLDRSPEVQANSPVGNVYRQTDEQFYSPQFLKSQKQKTESEQEEELQPNSVNKSLQGHRNKPQEITKLQSLNQARRINRILYSLKDIEADEPQVPYFHLIKSNYQEVKKRVHGNPKNLHLDISAVSFKAHTFNSSPSSVVSFSKDFLFERRLNTDPNQQIKETNRSESQKQCTMMVLRKENEHLKKQIQALELYIRDCEEREELLKVQISELSKKNIVLENQTSEKTVEKLFLRFLDNMFNEKCTEMENDCRTLLKVMGVGKIEAEKVADNFSRRKKKKNNGGLISGIFGPKA